MKIKGKKATLSITLPPELVKKAREYGLNISKIAENALKSYIERLEGVKTETNGGPRFLGEASFTKEGSKWARPDLNQRSSPREGDVLTS